MNQLQRNVIDVYLNKNKFPTLKKISEETGIQLTRVFRILNGSEMKISEFEKFSDAIKGQTRGVRAIFNEGIILPKDNQDLINKMERIEKMTKLKHLLEA